MKRAWIIEESWGPRSPFDEKTRVFLFIQQKILKNNKKKLSIWISPDNIIVSTGISVKNLSKVNKKLQEFKLLLFFKRDYGLIEYCFHPDRYGSDYFTSNPNEKVIDIRAKQLEKILEEEKESNDCRVSDLEFDEELRQSRESRSSYQK